MGSPVGLPIISIYALLLLANLDSKDESDEVIKDVERENKEWNERPVNLQNQRCNCKYCADNDESESNRVVLRSLLHLDGNHRDFTYEKECENH